jgi:hypothetical protein
VKRWGSKRQNDGFRPGEFVTHDVGEFLETIRGLILPRSA